MFMSKLNLETVTPMFLHGSDSNVLELRPPPFKSLMRYWWRTVQDCKTESLRKTEARFFGSTEGKAPFSIRISVTKDLRARQHQPLPHRSGSFRRSAYVPGQPFDLCLIARDESVVSSCVQTAKLGLLLGGVGNRSRRGFGSIRVTDWNFTKPSDLQREILETLNSVAGAERFQIKDQSIESKRPASSSLEYPVIQRIYFGQPTDNVDSLLRKIGQATHNHKHDALGYAKGQKRLASPIHVRVQKISSGYIPVVTQLYLAGNKPKQYQQKQWNFIDAIVK